MMFDKILRKLPSHHGEISVMERARKRIMHVELESLHLQHILSHNSLAKGLDTPKSAASFLHAFL